MATFERKLLMKATRIKKGWKGNPCLLAGNPESRDAKAGDWIVEPDGLLCAYPTVWPDKLFRANFEPVGEEAKELLNPPREKILYESEGHRVSLQISLDGIWIRFKTPRREGCFNLTSGPDRRINQEPIFRDVLKDFVDHLGLETPS